MAQVLLKNIEKIFPNGFHAVHKADIEIKDKEFMVLVGPSGCGKSTTLRMIAGLEEITDGELYIGDRLVNQTQPKNRDIAMVFQDYALYPHMNAYKNMAFSLKVRRTPKQEIDERVRKTAKILHIDSLLDKKPKHMSGGQRQRVALGRAIVRDPKVFLFDEPLSNLDAKLRVVMRAELSLLHRKLETTMVYVTHDQVEAMTMATRIVVMKDGYIQQIDNPYTLYNNPKNKFVAGFIGSPPMNFVKTLVKSKDDNIIVENEDISITPTKEQQNELKPYLNKEVYFGVRPEDISLDKTEYENKLEAYIKVIEPLGSESILYITTKEDVEDIDSCKIIVKVRPVEHLQPDQKLTFSVNIDKCHFFEAETRTSGVGNKEEICIV